MKRVIIGVIAASAVFAGVKFARSYTDVNIIGLSLSHLVISDYVTVRGNTTLGGSTTNYITIVGSQAVVSNGLILTGGNVGIGNTGAAGSTLDVVGSAAFGNETYQSTITTSGAALFSSSISVVGPANLWNTTQIGAAGTASTFTTVGALSIPQTMTAGKGVNAATATFSSTLNVQGAATLMGNVTLNAGATNTLTINSSTAVYPGTGIYLATAAAPSPTNTLSIVNGKLGVGLTNPLSQVDNSSFTRTAGFINTGASYLQSTADISGHLSIGVSTGTTAGAISNVDATIISSNPEVVLATAAASSVLLYQGISGGKTAFGNAWGSFASNVGAVTIPLMVQGNRLLLNGGAVNDDTYDMIIGPTGNVGINLPAGVLAATKLHVTSGTVTIDGNSSTKLKVGNAADGFEVVIASAAKIGDQLTVVGESELAGVNATQLALSSAASMANISVSAHATLATVGTTGAATFGSTAVIASTTSITAGTFAPPQMTQAVLVGTTFSGAGEMFNCTDCPGAATTGFLICVSTGNTIMGAVISTATAVNCAGL